MAEPILHWLQETWHIAVEAAPWLLLGLLAAGLIYGLVPTTHLIRWLGGRGPGAVVRASLIGAPLPLCSCGVIPAAVSLRRRGASPGATVSFLVATPETGVDSIAISYAMLGPFMTIVRPIAAVLSAIVAGFTTQLLPHRPGVALPIGPGARNAADDCCGSQKTSACCSDNPKDDSCCAATSETTDEAPRGVRAKVASGLRYAVTDLVDDLGLWIIVGLALAGAAATFMSPQMLETWSSSVWTMLAMALIGVPMYICATASTPLAAGMLLAGLSPGTVLVFLLAGPATNLATLGIVRRELGMPIVAGYVGAIVGSAVGLGLLTDWLAQTMNWSVQAQVVAAEGIVPHWLAVASLVVLVLLAIRPLRRWVIGG